MHGVLAPLSFGPRALAVAAVALALFTAALVLGAPNPAAAQNADACAVIDLGVLSVEDGGKLIAEGRWTDESCDSAFLPKSGAITYRFEMKEAAWLHIDLQSPEGDPVIHLLSSERTPIVLDDDSGDLLRARIERRLAAGVYFVEAASSDGRLRGPASFTLEIFLSTDCAPRPLGDLTDGVTLSAEGIWSHDDCRARYREDAPAQTFSFTVPEAGLVRVDLVSDNGDPYLYLLEPDGDYVYSDDDGGPGYNSRIENDLPAGTYLVEATTYFDRESVFSTEPFTLTVTLVDESRFRIKLEALAVPATVVAGQPFDIHYRVGNLGDRDLPAAGYSAGLIAFGTGRAFDFARPVPASATRWQAGASYHSGPAVASSRSAAGPEFRPLSLTIPAAGPAWVYVAILARDPMGTEISVHRAWRRLLVLSNPTFATVAVTVAGVEYRVTASADDEGRVTFLALAPAMPAAEVGESTRAKAIYAAATRALTLPGIGERVRISAPASAASAAPVSLPNPSAAALLRALGRHYADALAASGLDAASAAGEAIAAVAVEDLALSAGETASRQYAPVAASWAALNERLVAGGALSFAEAFTVQTQLAWAEALAQPLATAAEAVRAARAAADGWDDAAVKAMLAGLSAQAMCESPPTLGAALEAAGAESPEALVALDAELRDLVPAFGLATDAALCAIAARDEATNAFVERLGLEESDVAAMLVPPAPAPPPATTLRLRLIARLVAGRVEFGVEVAGERILPERRFVRIAADDRRWYVTADVEVEGAAIGRIRARRLDDGRIEFGFLDSQGAAIAPAARYLPAAPPAGAWLRSSEIEAPRPAASAP